MSSKIYLNSIYSLSPVPKTNGVSSHFFDSEKTSILSVFLEEPTKSEINAFNSDTYVLTFNRADAGGILYFAPLNIDDKFSILLEAAVNFKQQLNCGYDIHFPSPEAQSHKFIIIIVDTTSGSTKAIKTIDAPTEIITQIAHLGIEQCKSRYSESDINTANALLINKFKTVEDAFEELPLYLQG